MEKTIIFRPPDLPPTLNGKKGLLRMHWSDRKKLKEKYMWLIREQKIPKFKPRVVVEVTNYAIRLMDWDNLAGRFKIIGDALVGLKLLKDDNPDVVVNFTMVQYRVHKKAEVRIEFRIIEV